MPELNTNETTHAPLRAATDTDHFVVVDESGVALARRTLFESMMLDGRCINLYWPTHTGPAEIAKYSGGSTSSAFFNKTTNNDNDPINCVVNDGVICLGAETFNISTWKHYHWWRTSQSPELYSVMAMIYVPDASATSGRIVVLRTNGGIGTTQGDGSNMGFVMDLSANACVCQVANNSTNATKAETSDVRSFLQNGWNMLAGVASWDGVDTVVNLYINGDLAGTATRPGGDNFYNSFSNVSLKSVAEAQIAMAMNYMGNLDPKTQLVFLERFKADYGIS